MTPTDLHRTTVASPVGRLTLVASDRGLRAVLWPDDRAGRVPLPDQVPEDPDHAVLAEAAAQLDQWFAGDRTAFGLPLDPEGTDFQQQVWRALVTIPHGRTRTYGEVAEAAVGDRGKARAVGAAIGRNPLSIVVPCHRVVGADGSLTGFAGGVSVKRQLLDHESGARLPLGDT
ncbi:MAG: methylated-DNA--[protein]-cysteine S-methyltransferase [Iamia sp.]